jgi:(p)ppGpp synthase/HD superfamily hydrolase
MVATPIRRAEQLLETSIADPNIVRHAAEVQAQLLAWGLAEQVQLGALVLPLLATDQHDVAAIVKQFGKRPLQIARIAARFNVGRSHNGQAATFAKTLRDLYCCAYVDVETALVCAADRIASTSQLDDMSIAAQRQWGRETLAVDVPFFAMLGMQTLHHSMANLALALLDRDQYLRYEEYIEAYYHRHEPTFQDMIAVLGAALADYNFADTLIQMYETTPATLYQREQQAIARGKPYHPADVGMLRVDVLLDNIADCYRALGLLHHLWRPSASTPIRDEIAAPHANGYRALTTTVHCSLNEQAVEFRLVTYDIEHINRNGVTAGAPVPGAWWQDQELSSQVGIRQTRSLDDTICALTPNGDVIYPLKRGYTLVDFAFKVHSQLAPYARKFIVNGEPKPFHTEVRHRDMIAIEYDESFESLTPDWETAAKSSTAKSNIKRYLRRKTSTAHRGRQAIDNVLERESAIYNMRFSSEQVDSMLKVVKSAYGCPTVGALYARVAAGNVAPDDVVAGLIERDLAVHILILDPTVEAAAPEISLARSWMQLPEPQRWQREFRITPQTEIVGRFVDDLHPPRLIVHRADSPHAPTDDEAIPLSWGHSDHSDQEALQVVVTSTRRQGVGWAVLNEIHRAAKDSQSDLLVHRFQSDVQQEVTQVDATLNIASPDYITHLQQNLNALKNTGLIKSFKLWQLFPGERMLLNRRSTRRYRNPFQVMYVRDEAMFYGRDREIQLIVDHIRAGVPFIIIHGHKRIGKTSLMYHLAERVLPDACPDVIPVVFNAQEAAPIDAESFAETMLEAAEQVVIPLLRRADDRQALRLSAWDLSKRPLDQILAWVKLAHSYLNGRRLYFMIDEFTALYEAYEARELALGFFQRLDAILDQGQIDMLLCIHDHVLREMQVRSQNMNQRSELVGIRELSETAARALIREPLHQLYTFADGVEDRIIQLTNAHPYFIHVLCGEIVQQMQHIGKAHITHDALRFAVVQVLDSAFHRFASYRSTTDPLGMETLRSIAALGGDENRHWASIESVRERVMRHYREIGIEVDPIDIYKRIDELNHTGMIRKKILENQKAAYKVSVGLMHIWLWEGTRQVPQHLA